MYTHNFRYIYVYITAAAMPRGGGPLESRIDHWEHYVPKCVCVCVVYTGR